MVRIGGGSTKFVLSERWIVYTKSRKQLFHRKYLLYEKAVFLRKAKVSGLALTHIRISSSLIRTVC